jgi:hypothetical protein
MEGQNEQTKYSLITDRIRNKIRNGNWFPKFSINRKEQNFLPICLRLLTLLTIIKDPSLRDLRGNQELPIDLSTENKKDKRSAYEKERRPGRSFNQKWKDKMNKQMTT